MIIGICGKSGSGKSRLAREIMKLSKNEVVHLDIDKVGHNALTPKEAQEEFPAAELTRDRMKFEIPYID